MIKKAKIYCLIESRTWKPFYVGATTGTLRDRLWNHLTKAKSKQEYKKGKLIERSEFIRGLINEGHNIQIALIKEVPFKDCNRWEEYYYNDMISKGYDLIQTNYQFVFCESVPQRLKSITKNPPR